jgi:hypothetical protein
MSECPGGNVIKVKPGWWRPHNQTSDLAKCEQYPTNCEGGS